MIPIAAFGFLSPVVGAFAMSVESLLVLGNSYKIKFINFKKEIIKNDESLDLINDKNCDGKKNDQENCCTKCKTCNID